MWEQDGISGPPDAGATPEVVRFAAQALTPGASRLSERILQKITQEIPYYADPLLAPQDLRATVFTGIETGLAALSTPDRFTDSAEFSWHLGARRATEGVPLLPLNHAYRIAGTEVWNGMVDVVAAQAPESSGRLVRAASDLFRHVERDTKLMLDGYRRISGDLPVGDGRALLPVLKALLRGHRDPMDLTRVALVFDIPLHGRYAVARLSGPANARPADAPISDRKAGMVFYWCPHQEGHAVIVQLGEHSPQDLAAALGAGGARRAGISPVVRGLAGLGRARELADLALSTCRTDGELAHLSDRMAAGLLVSRPDLAAELKAMVLGPVLELEPAERGLLLETLGAWLDCNGSAGQAGKLLYCHRNTVHNRLRRLERLTGRMLDRPRDLVELSLALDAHRFGATESR